MLVRQLCSGNILCQVFKSAKINYTSFYHNSALMFCVPLIIMLLITGHSYSGNFLSPHGQIPCQCKLSQQSCHDGK